MMMVAAIMMVAATTTTTTAMATATARNIKSSKIIPDFHAWSFFNLLAVVFVVSALTAVFALTVLYFESDLSGCESSLSSLDVCFFSMPVAHASQHHNTYLSVSAQNDVFDNHFAGSMVVEVEIHDPAISNTDGSAGEPHVSINGDTLRMVQARNGNWYGYFANLDAAKNADQTSLDGGTSGRGLDFGVFCGSSTSASVLGITFSDSDAVAIPRSDGLYGYADGRSAISACEGEISQTSPVINNIVRSPPSLVRSSSSSPTTGGEEDVSNTVLNPGAWPVVQLFSFSGDVRVQYERGGGSERVLLRYGDISSIHYTTDRAEEPYPARAEMILHVYDPQLNQDPTDEDSWTFGISPSSQSVFYHAFYAASGRTSSDVGSGLVNLYPYLNRLGFDDNGHLAIDTGGVIELKRNKNQPTDSISDGRGVHYSDIVTLVETRPNSGVFTSVDSSGISNMRIAPDAARGTSAVITYDDRSSSVLTGSHTASLDLPRNEYPDDGSESSRPVITVDAEGWRSGMRIPIILHDADQNIRPNMRDDLDVYRYDALVPSIRIGSPLTAYGASSVMLYTGLPSGSGSQMGSDGSGSSSSTSAFDTVAIPVLSSDSASARLYLDVGGSKVSDMHGPYMAMSIQMGFTASDLFNTLVDTSLSSAYGTNWIHVDVRSFEMVLDSAGGAMSDASMSLYFGDMSDDSPVLITPRLGSAQNLVYLKPDVVSEISSKSGVVYAVFEMDSGKELWFDAQALGDDVSTNQQQQRAPTPSVLPITVDVFSFGVRGNDNVNNAIYRLELEETVRNSGVFEGTLEFAAVNQLNIDDPDFISKISPTGNNVKFITLGRMTQEDSITITYPDLARVGTTVPQSLSTTTSTTSPSLPSPSPSSTNTDITPKSGTVSVSSSSGTIRFGTPVTVTLYDPDLNLSADTIEVYHTVDDARLPSVDTVGSGPHTLLEIKFKDIRYKRCVVDGTEYGGLASSGFALIETGPSTGIFEGIFKMPTWMCNKSGSDIISTAGGSLDVIYYDSRDSSGQPNKFSTLRSQVGVDASSVTAHGHTGTLSDQKDPTSSNPNTVYDPKSRDAYDAINSTPASLQLEPQDPSLYLDRDNILLDANDAFVITLSGNVGVPVSNYLVSVHLIRPDLTVQTFDLRAGADGKFGMPIIIKNGIDMPGTYIVNVTSVDTLVGSSSFRVESDDNTTAIVAADVAVEDTFLQPPTDSNKTWSFGLGPDASFSSAFERMVKHGVIHHTDLLANTYSEESLVYDDDYNIFVPIFPLWLDDYVMKWWSDELISDLAFVRLTQYMLDTDLILFEDM